MLGLFQNFNVCDEVNQANVEIGADTALMNALEMTYVTAVGHPSLVAEVESDKHHVPADLYLCVVSQAFVAPNTFLQSTK